MSVVAFAVAQDQPLRQFVGFLLSPAPTKEAIPPRGERLNLGVGPPAGVTCITLNLCHQRVAAGERWLCRTDG